MVEIKEEPKKGVPAYMATFADLMTLLLVFFILLNVYANEKQYGLLSAMTGSITSAFHDDMGQGGLLSGAKTPFERKEPRTDFKHVEEGEGPETEKRRTGHEVEMKKSSAHQHGIEEELRIASPFAFPHGSDELTHEMKKYLDGFVRRYGSPSLTVKIVVKSAFVESFQPMELGYRRLRRILDHLDALGMTSRLVPTAKVVKSPRMPNKGAIAPYRAVDVIVVRQR